MAGKRDLTRWVKAFAKARATKTPKPAPLDRYTNLSLGHIWEKFDCQTQLLCREALIPVMQRNPALLDPPVANPVAKK
eukprot:g17359.t1